MMKAFIFGEVLWDIYPDSRFIGGAPLNFAAHFAKCGGESYLCSAIGKDELAKETLCAVQQLSVNTKYISQSDKATGRCMVTLDENSVPSYKLLADTAYDDIPYPNLKNEAFDALYFGTLALRAESNFNCLRKIVENNRFDEIFVDVNIRKPHISEATLRYAVNNATVLKLSDEELPVVLQLLHMEKLSPEETAKRLCKVSEKLKTVIVTLGEKGSFAYDKQTDGVIHCAAQKTTAVSTVGAGDSFSAAFLSEYLRGKSLADCLAFASKISGFVVSHKEAVPDYDRSAIGQAIRNHKK